jgi:tetratricopeptide (TPR) repeat protein
MRSHILIVLLGLMFISTAANAENTCLSTYEKYQDKDWQKVISSCEEYIKTDQHNAEAYLDLAFAYHGSKTDFKKALYYYKKAAALNENYKLYMVPLLDELEDWQQIIELALPEMDSGNCDPSILGSLASAYHAFNNQRMADEVIKHLKNCTYDKQNSKDYQLYILAYVSLWNDDQTAALNYLKEIKTASLLEYARTAPKFKKLYGLPEFKKITGQ